MSISKTIVKEKKNLDRDFSSMELVESTDIIDWYNDKEGNILPHIKKKITLEEACGMITFDEDIDYLKYKREVIQGRK